MVDPDSVKLPLPTQAELDSKPRFEREQLRVYAGTLDLTPEAIRSRPDLAAAKITLENIDNIAQGLRLKGPTP